MSSSAIHTKPLVSERITNTKVRYYEVTITNFNSKETTWKSFNLPTDFLVKEVIADAIERAQEINYNFDFKPNLREVYGVEKQVQSFVDYLVRGITTARKDLFFRLAMMSQVVIYTTEKQEDGSTKRNFKGWEKHFDFENVNSYFASKEPHVIEELSQLINALKSIIDTKELHPYISQWLLNFISTDDGQDEQSTINVDDLDDDKINDFIAAFESQINN